MEEPTSNNDENKNPEEPTTAPLTTGAEPSSNETTPGEVKEEPTSESSTSESSFSVPDDKNNSSSDAATSDSSQSSESVTESTNTPEPVVPSNEPPKIDVAAAEAESAATPSVPESTTGSGVDTQASASAASSSLAIDNPHPTAPGVKHGLPVLVVAVIAAILGLGGGFAVAAASGVSFKKQAAQTVEAPKVVAKELKVPDDATVISECAKGRGKQYVRPKDIPQGPVYNVFNGKVIGIEYMLGQKDMLANKDYLNLLLEGVAYDHMNVGLLSKGHSGYPEPHYHIDVFTVSAEEASKITCQ